VSDVWYWNNEPALVNLSKFVYIHIEKLDHYVVWGKLPDTLTEIKIDKFNTKKQAEDFLKRTQELLNSYWRG
jgi:hypothetical protein